MGLHFGGRILKSVYGILKLLVYLTSSVVGRVAFLAQCAGGGDVVRLVTGGRFLIFTASNAAWIVVAIRASVAVVLTVLALSSSRRLCGSSTLIFVWRMDEMSKIVLQFLSLAKSTKRSRRAIFVRRCFMLTTYNIERLKFSKEDFNSSHDVDRWRFRSTTLKDFSL